MIKTLNIFKITIIDAAKFALTQLGSQAIVQVSLQQFPGPVLIHLDSNEDKSEKVTNFIKFVDEFAGWC